MVLLVVGKVLFNLPCFGFGVGAGLRLKQHMGVLVRLLGVLGHVVQVVLGGGDSGLLGSVCCVAGVLEGMGRGGGCQGKRGEGEQNSRRFYSVHGAMIGRGGAGQLGNRQQWCRGSNLSCEAGKGVATAGRGLTH